MVARRVPNTIAIVIGTVGIAAIGSIATVTIGRRVIPSATNAAAKRE